METLAVSPNHNPPRKRGLEYCSNPNIMSPDFTASTASNTAYPSQSVWNQQYKKAKIRSVNDENFSPFGGSPEPLGKLKSTSLVSDSPSRIPNFEGSGYGESKRIKLGMDSVSCSSPSSGVISNSLQKQLESMTQYHESQIASLRAEYEAKLHQKDEQVIHISKLSKQLYEANTKFENENKLVIDENKLLKKAFGIQDNRLKEVVQQNQQCQVMIQQLSEYSASLEQANNQLKQELKYIRQSGNSQNSNFFFPPPPPDVY